ncbi:MAG: radical SAM protein [Candidatus Omnitrophica bacterium]|nr:radical SAM protein [Candidatus Omnitrophota bacterium]
MSTFQHRMLRPLATKAHSRNLVLCINEHLAKQTPWSRYHLYVHIPFCATDCTYCHCAHAVLKSATAMTAYVESLCRQANVYGELFDGTNMQSLYLGGGTPSLLTASLIEKLLRHIYSRFRFTPHAQVDFEAHPASLDPHKLKMLKSLGVNRLTLGVQSLDPKVLKAIRRPQSIQKVYRCAQEAKYLNFGCLNIDLVAGLPGQTTQSFIATLRRIIDLKPDVIHLIPLCDVTAIRGDKQIGRDIPGFLTRRHQMLKEAKDILADQDYTRHGFEAFQRGKTGKNVQQDDYFNRGCSIVGMGLYAQTMLLPDVYARCTSFNGQPNDSYEFCPIDKTYTLATWLIPQLLAGIKEADFCGTFSTSLTKAFGKELRFLERQGICGCTGGEWRYQGKKTPEGLFEFFSRTKILFGPEFLRRLRHACQGIYNPGHTYTFQKDAFFKKMDDVFFANTLYDVGF